MDFKQSAVRLAKPAINVILYYIAGLKINMTKKINYFNILKLVLGFLSILSFVGALVYRIYTLNYIGIELSLVITIAIFLPLATALKIREEAEITSDGSEKKEKSIFYLLAAFYFISLFVSFYKLFTHQTVKAIVSPWQVVPTNFFIWYFAATLILISMLVLTKIKKDFKVFFIALHYLLSFSVALIVYKIGYGYDPFIHGATLDLIDKLGAVYPKPFYYLGQYGLMEVIHKTFFIPLTVLNKYLVPVMAAIFLPFFGYQNLSARFSDKKTILLSILALLVFPFSFFIITVPQSLAFLFLLLLVLAGLNIKNKADLWLIFYLSLATLSIHPIAGIPAILFSVILAFHYLDLEHKKIFYPFLYFLTAVTLPSAFYFLENGASSPFHLSWSNFSLPQAIMPWKENFLYNFLYLYGFNIGIIITGVILIGIIFYFRQKKQYEIFSLYLWMSFSLALAYLFTKNFTFDYLIEYERNSFPDRILAAAMFFLVPFLFLVLYDFIKKILEAEGKVKWPFLIFLAALITASLYLSYPRFDKYFNSKGYSTGTNDIQAVHLINDTAKKDYIVLANQQVSAAALNEFGFDKYYQNDIFYYPVPTGGPLYQYYLDMVYKKPSKSNMTAAMDLAGVKEGYFVLNKYWWAFPKVLDEAKLAADQWWSIGQGDVYVFRYSR